MNVIKLFILIACISITGPGCKKDSAPYNCQALKNAVITGSKDDIKSLINSYINRLPSQAYTEQNINTLNSSLSGECSIATTLICFDCVSTLPSITEIQVTVVSSPTNISKVIDISYTPENKMTCVFVHD
jgi:hypothetical protein